MTRIKTTSLQVSSPGSGFIGENISGVQPFDIGYCHDTPGNNLSFVVQKAQAPRLRIHRTLGEMFSCP
jgi:hypothetical protein